MVQKLAIAIALLSVLPIASQARTAVVKKASAPKVYPHNSYEADPRFNPNCYFSTEQATWICK